jgi:hypothetical protein
MACISPEFLKKITSLTSLTLYNNECDPSLPFLTQLRSLNIPSPIHVPESLTLLTNLTKLVAPVDLKSEHVSTLNHLTSLKKCASVAYGGSSSFHPSLQKLSCSTPPASLTGSPLLLPRITNHDWYAKGNGFSKISGIF